MKKQQFNFEEVFSFAWAKTKQHAWFLACSFMIYAVILSAVGQTPILRELTWMLGVLSMLSMSLIIARGESFNFSDLFNKLRSPDLVIKFLVLTILYILAVFVLIVPFFATASIVLQMFLMNGIDAVSGKLLIVLLTTLVMLIPGIYVAVRFKFYPYVLLENEHMKVVDIIKHTNKLTCCAFWSLLAFFLLLSILNIIGALAFGVGLFLTVPVSILSMAHLYRKLEHHTH